MIHLPTEVFAQKPKSLREWVLMTRKSWLPLCRMYFINQSVCVVMVQMIVEHSNRQTSASAWVKPKLRSLLLLLVQFKTSDASLPCLEKVVDHWLQVSRHLNSLNSTVWSSSSRAFFCTQSIQTWLTVNSCTLIWLLCCLFQFSRLGLAPMKSSPNTYRLQHYSTCLWLCQYAFQL